MRIKYVIFDVAGTLLHKPSIYTIIQNILFEAGYQVSKEEIILKHKLVSELILFPDKTSKAFYDTFNQELLLSLGIFPSDDLVKCIFNKCTYMPWEVFEDTKHIKNINLPKGVLSNWDKSLKEKLDDYFPDQFQRIIGSADAGIRKPDSRFYKLLISELGCEAGDILYVGDSMRLDIAPAIREGIDTVLIDRFNIYPNAGVNRISDMKEISAFL